MADLEFQRLEWGLAKCSNVAIDVAVMEKTELGSVLPQPAGVMRAVGVPWETSEQRDASAQGR